MKKITHIRQKLLISLAMAVYVVVLYLSPISCPVLALTGVRCLGCGMTRAWLRALELDFAGAFGYHMMFWSVPILYIAFWTDGKLFRSKRLNVSFFLIILVGFVINWSYHQFF